MTERERWVDKVELADHLGVSESWIQQQMAKGLPFIKLGQARNSPVRFRLSVVEEWLGT